MFIIIITREIAILRPRFNYWSLAKAIAVLRLKEIPRRAKVAIHPRIFFNFLSSSGKPIVYQIISSGS